MGKYLSVLLGLAAMAFGAWAVRSTDRDFLALPADAMFLDEVPAR